MARGKVRIEPQEQPGRGANRKIIRGGIAMPDAARILGDELARDVYKK